MRYQHIALPIELVGYCLVPQNGIEPLTDAYKATVIPLNYKGNTWSRMKDSNLRSPAPKAGGLSQTFLIRDCLLVPSDGFAPSTLSL